MAPSAELSIVLLTREELGQLGALVQAGGAQLVHVPLIERAPTGHLPPPARPRFVLVTSAAAARFATELEAKIGDAVVVAVGPRTANALQKRGVKVAAVGDAGGVEAVRLLGSLGADPGLDPSAIWHVSAEKVSAGLDAALRPFGTAMGRWAVYRTQTPAGVSDALRAVARFDVVTFASGSAAASFATHGTLGAARVAVIGPSTAAVARDHGLPVHAVASHQTIESLAQAALSLCDRG